MKPMDYSRSFVMGKWPGNEVRFWIESRTRLIDEIKGVTEDYIQCGSCKSEDTFAEQKLFYKDNYDFLPIFGPEFGLIFRRKAWLNPDYRTIHKSEDMWGGQIYYQAECHSAVELTSPEEMLQSTYEWFPLVAQTAIRNSTTGLSAIIEYPVKTMNTRSKGNEYQIDTGPVALPDLEQRADRLVDTLSLAFVAFNAPHFADFVIEAPTSVGGSKDTGEVQIYHYSQLKSCAAKNRLFAIKHVD